MFGAGLDLVFTKFIVSNTSSKLLSASEAIDVFSVLNVFWRKEDIVEQKEVTILRL
jgi:hypothetical protein